MIGGMAFSGSTLPGGLLRRLATALVVVAASLAAGCDAEPETSPTDRGDELGRSASELDQTGGDAGDDGDEGAVGDDEASPAEVEVVSPPGGSSPLDPRAEPDPIPWVPRSNGNHDV